MKKKIIQTHRLLITVEDKKKKRIVRNGNELIPIKTIELTKLNLGSIKNPNRMCKNIFSIRLEPIRYN